MAVKKDTAYSLLLVMCFTEVGIQRDAMRAGGCGLRAVVMKFN